jgi:hypothetical protein
MINLRPAAVASAAALTSMLGAACASAQAPVTHRPSADTIIAAVLDQGAVYTWSRYVDFQGCPQNDPLGAAVLAGLQPTTVNDFTIGELSSIWADELNDCGSEPLEEWYGSALFEIAEPIAWSRFLAALPSPLPATFSSDLLNRANTTGVEVAISAAALDVLSDQLTGIDRLDFLLEQASSGAAPEPWIRHEVQFLFQTLGTTYVNRVAEAAPDLNDRLIHYAVDPIWNAIDSGELSAEAPSVVALASAIEGRGSLDYLHDALTPGAEPWSAGTSYSVGDEVAYDGLDYRCRQGHTAQAGWQPPNVYALWERINTGGLWAPQVIYQVGDEASYLGVTYAAIQGHQSQTGWEPPNQPALWEISR